MDLKAFRKERGWTQERLANELGVDKSTVWRWENDQVQLRGYVAKAIERLGVEYPAGEAAE